MSVRSVVDLCVHVYAVVQLCFFYDFVTWCVNMLFIVKEMLWLNNGLKKLSKKDYLLVCGGVCFYVRKM